MFYAVVLDLGVMFAFVFWQVEVPLVIMSILPIVVNILLLSISESTLEQLI